MRSAKTRTTAVSGKGNRSFPLGPNVAGDQVLLGIPLTTEPGDYSVDVTFVSQTGEERAAAIQVTVAPVATPVVASSTPPVVLLDGFQATLGGPCPMASDSSGTFGNLQSYLGGPPNNILPIYFFENCTECPGCPIEELGADLAAFLNALPYPQVDVVAHSMGGLIVRSYLSGKQASGFSPPSAPKIRKAVFVATPHFGAFAADFTLAELFFTGAQTDEMKPGSQFVWDLGRWNQFSDDLRGVDAISIVGTAGPSGQSDGVVESTSASLDFRALGRTRVVDYCHVSGSTAGGLAGLYLDCQAPGIAYVDTTAHPTYQIVSSFLMSGAAWQSVGIAPSEDGQLSKYGGMVVGYISGADQYFVPAAVSWGSVNLSQGGAAELYYDDFVSGSGTFNFGTSTCGPWTETPGIYSTVRCKFAPSIFSVGPLVSGTGKVVQAGGTITIAGSGFGAQCSACGVTAANPNAAALQVLSWSDSAIIAVLPASFGTGFATIGVTTASGSDAIDIMAGVLQPLDISLSPSSLNFAYNIGGAIPAAQTVTAGTGGGGNLTYSASSNAAWLLVSVSGSTIMVSVNPSGLAANTYQGVIAVSAPGASNSPQTIAVSLVVARAIAPMLSIGNITNSATGLGGAVAPGELISIFGANLGPATGVRFSLNAAGMVSGSLAGTQVTVGGVGAPVLYSSATQVNAIVPYEMAGQSQAAVVVEYEGASAAGTVAVQNASPGVFTVNSAGAGPAVAANQDGTMNGPSNPAAKGSYVTVYWTGGGQTNPAGVTGAVTGDTLQWLTQAISVSVGGQPAAVSFDGSAPGFVDGVDQLNIQLSANTPSGAQPLVITVGGISSPSSATLSVQ